jgi:hypothetical protein
LIEIKLKNPDELEDEQIKNNEKNSETNLSNEGKNSPKSLTSPRTRSKSPKDSKSKSPKSSKKESIIVSTGAAKTSDQAKKKYYNFFTNW